MVKEGFGLEPIHEIYADHKGEYVTLYTDRGLIYGFLKDVNVSKKELQLSPALIPQPISLNNVEVNEKGVWISFHSLPIPPIPLPKSEYEMLKSFKPKWQAILDRDLGKLVSVSVEQEQQPFHGTLASVNPHEMMLLPYLDYSVSKRRYVEETKRLLPLPLDKVKLVMPLSQKDYEYYLTFQPGQKKKKK